VPATILINSTDRPVPQSAGRHMRGQVVGGIAWAVPFTAGGEADISKFFQFTITDKDPASVDQKLFEIYNREIDFTLINANQNLRRYEANNLNASPAGLGYWTTEVVATIKADWENGDGTPENPGHPLADITTIGFPNTGPNGLGNIWDFSGVFQPGEGAEFTAVVHEAGLGVMDYRTIWRITEAGMINIGNAGGLQSGTAAQLSGILVDERTL
jgi:hypothetical protein